MNLDIYTEEMKKSLWDKAFFMDKIIGVKCVIDFGCADASLICMLREIFPSMDFYGFDINEELLARARENMHENVADRKFIYGGDELNLLIADVISRYEGSEICINFSCVLHEVFSTAPCGKRSIERLVKALEPKYITVRDMHAPRFNYTNDYIDQVKEPIEEKYIEEFQKKFNCSSLYRTDDFLHFMMKYQWKDNGWEEELEEDYFSFNVEDFMTLINEDEYRIVYINQYLLPFYADKWAYLKLDPYRDTTHIQLVIRHN